MALAVEFSNVVKVFGGVRALDGLSFKLSPAKSMG